ncbi:MAG TPA: universal stress protein [Candidatus Cybelea sp.]|nr:universal stress protein [Candidatus Cybelea sp.]
MAADASASRRRSKFLVVVDNTPECKLALRFATHRARNVGGGVTLLHVIEPPEVQHWAAVANVMQQEAREEAERLMQDLATQVHDDSGIMPELVIREGRKIDGLLSLIAEDPSIRILVLGAGTGSEGPGPLVSALAGQMSGTLSIPITLVPGGLSPEQVDELT